MAGETPAEIIDCLETEATPKIGGKPVRWAEDLKKYEDGTCKDYSILTYGTPGWLWLYIGGSWQLVCGRILLCTMGAVLRFNYMYSQALRIL